MRKIANSGGFAGAMPMRPISRSLSMSFRVIVVRLHRTRKAAPARRRAARPRLLWLSDLRAFPA
jgi:hypothetical protein